MKFLERNGYNYHITKITKKKIKEYIHLPINEEIIETEEPSLLKIKQDTAKFVASGIGKHKYGTRTDTDLTTGGKPIGHLLDNLEK